MIMFEERHFHNEYDAINSYSILKVVLNKPYLNVFFKGLSMRFVSLRLSKDTQLVNFVMHIFDNFLYFLHFLIYC